MRAQVVTHMSPTESHPEAGVFVEDQVEALRRLGVEVELRRFRGGARSYVTAGFELRRRRRDERYDVVHAHYGLTGWSAWLAGRRPLVVTFHGTDLRHRLVGPLSRLLVGRACLPAAVSGALARESVPGAGTRRRVAVLPCGIDLGRFRPIERADARRRLGLDPARPYLLFPSDPSRQPKRHDRALALAAEFPEAELLTLHGVQPSEAPVWVNASNAVLVTSDREGFGLATLEALACDVPVLSTPVGIAPLAIRGIQGALCAPFEVAPWRRALEPHVTACDPRVPGRSRATLFSSDRMAKRVLAAYEALVPPSKR